MRRWHPPVPAGKLYSGPALDIGPALAMLLWCYDGIQRDGTIEVSIETAALEIGKPYRTVKDWWKQLREGGFFAEMKDHGRNGWTVRLADEWIDWRIMAHNYPDNEGRKAALEQENEGQKTAPDTAQVPLKSRSSPGEGRKAALETSAHKVLIDSDQAESHGGSEDQDRTRRTHPPAVATLFEIFPDATISREQGDDVCSTVTDVAFWREVLVTWKANGYKPRIGNLLDRYQKDLAKGQGDAKAHRNGRKQYTPPTPEWAGFKASDPDKPL